MKQTINGYLKNIKEEYTKTGKPYQNLLVLQPGQKDEFGERLQSFAGNDKIWKIANFKDINIEWLRSMINRPIKIEAYLNCTQYTKESDNTVDYIYSMNAMSITAINTQANSQSMSSGRATAPTHNEIIVLAKTDEFEDLPF